LTFAVDYSQHKCAHLFENIFTILMAPQVFLHTQIVNPTALTNSQSNHRD